MERKNNIVWVAFPKPTRPSLQPSLGVRQNWFFSSLAAIYDLFTHEQIGCLLRDLWSAKLKNDHSFDAGKCTVMKATALTKKQKNHEQGKS